MGHPVFYNVTCIDLRFPERYHEKISYQQYLVLLSELSRRNVKQALSGVRVAPSEISASTYRWVEVGELSGNSYYILSTDTSLCAGPRDDKTADEEAHRRVGHIFCGFAEDQVPAYEHLKEELPRLAASLTIIPIAIEDRDPR